tara:strand:+ start:1813 stop:2013 length:201 start_codon:yes stop_codon:yes gene_type:complete
MKRSNFYPNGEFIPRRMPQDFRPSQGKYSCGSCGVFSRKHSFCFQFRTRGVRDTYVCNKWRPRTLR